jgi:hypothetical protein
MGQATDRKVSEIEETRRQLEADLTELEERMPAPLRSAKALVGILIGSTALTALVLRAVRSKRPDERPSAEVVVRIVRDDV